MEPFFIVILLRENVPVNCPSLMLCCGALKTFVTLSLSNVLQQQMPMLNPTDFDRLSLTVFFSTSTVFECVNLGSDKHLCHTELVECETATNHNNYSQPYRLRSR